jgi:hypothetical protein
MPGFLGGSTSGGGVGGEISFPKELIDPVTKLRVSEPETLIDTDFEYGLQPTKWETLELINNTPSFFSKSGDTTIPDILSVTTNAGTREITVLTALDHGLSVGIPINVTGTKSVTADGAYIINSIPNGRTFTYLCKDNQAETLSIEDLYTSIITGEFFQGSQLRIADSDGIVTDGQSVSVLTVTTESNHGFGVNTPFYFLNLNSTVAQEFEAANTAAKSFDASNSATAQTFDGSNTLAQIQVDLSNSAVIGGVASNITAVDTAADTITVSHSSENFSGRPLGTPLYYNVVTSAGYFSENPRGVVFLKTTGQLGTSTSTFQVSAVPDGTTIDLQAGMTGTFRLANQARTFAGNNVSPETQTSVNIIYDSPLYFDGSNGRLDPTTGLAQTNQVAVVSGYSGSLITGTPDGGGNDLDFYQGKMVQYTTTGAAATGLTNNRTYFIDSFFRQGTTNVFSFTIKELPTSPTAITISGGTGTQRFSAIGISVDKDVFHIRNHGYAANDMLQYDFPVSGNFTTVDSAQQKLFYYVENVYDAHNFTVVSTVAQVATASGLGVTPAGTLITDPDNGFQYRVFSFTTVGTGGTITFTQSGQVEYMVIAGGGGGGMDMGGGGGAGGYLAGTATVTGGATYTVTVGGGGRGGPQPGTFGQNFGHQFAQSAQNGGNSSFIGTGISLTAVGGGFGGSSFWQYTPNFGQANSGGSGGGASGYSDGRATNSGYGGANGTPGQGNRGSNGGPQYYSGGGGGAGGQGNGAGARSDGGPGVRNTILGVAYFWAGGGGGSGHTITGGFGGIGGGGGGAVGTAPGGGSAINSGGNGGGGPINAQANTPGGNGGANTGGGGGGGAHYAANNKGGDGGSGIVVVRFRV